MTATDEQSDRIAELEAALRAFVSMHPIYLAGTLGSLDEAGNTGNRLAAAIAQARRALGEKE